MLFVGNGALTMKPVLETHGMSFHYNQLDIRQLDGCKLVASVQISDNVLALMTRLNARTAGIRQVLRKIDKLEAGPRNSALSLLFSKPNCGAWRIL